ncbi:hypothetical protein Clacol_002868 [Clathrus columnatus]|uniref:Rho1 guanine nucleotide exchange factor 1 n=1 Tax=Clathrus columnatus TaxID=1419009 RepID=A0AAV5A7C8_9AGAM|nr:hypothetical protein Clacol_002868 [Clathrus columnatus]
MSAQRNVPSGIPPGARPPVIPGSPIDAPMYVSWPTQDPMMATRRTSVRHTPQSPYSNVPPSSSYVTSPTIAFPEPELYNTVTPPPLPPKGSPAKYTRHPTQPQIRYNTKEVWQSSEPPVVRLISHQSSLRPPSHPRPRAYSSTGPHPQLQLPQHSHSLKHKHSYSSDVRSSQWQTNNEDVDDAFDRSPSIVSGHIADNISNLSLDDFASDVSDKLLEQYQKGQGDDNSWEWHRLVPKEALESLPKAEVIRQSAIFELINGERNYVRDLELVQEIFIGGLESTMPPVIKEGKTDAFINEVFHNIPNILTHHKRLLDALFLLQREQHPIILSIGNIILETIFKFQEDYDQYIKHYPVAESVHRRELKNNLRYRKFLELRSHDPRLAKRDLITFIARPVTRLPRLSLQLEEIRKRTEKLSEGDGDLSSSSLNSREDYPDLETIPILVDVLDKFVKITQPGIAASENKVKYYALCESLEFRRGEIISVVIGDQDMDLYNETRSLVYTGELARKQRADNWSKWMDLEVALLDNYLLITQPDPATGSKEVVSRPLPVEYIRLGSFTGPSDSRREERAENGGLFHAFIKSSKPMYPLVLYHASSPARRYTLFASSEEIRVKWKEVLKEAISMRKIVVDSNKWFGMDAVETQFFRIRTSKVPLTSTGMFTGDISSATLFSANGKSYVAVATSTGIYAGVRGLRNYTKVLPLPSAKGIIAMPMFRKLIVLYNDQLKAYSLDIIARVVEKKVSTNVLEDSAERLAKADRGGSILFFRIGIVAERTLIVYAIKGFLNVTINGLEAVLESPQQALRRIQSGTGTPTFRPFGEPFYVPKDPFDVTLLAKTIAVSTERLMVVVDPTKLSTQTPVPIPDFTNASESIGISVLKAKAENSRPLGIVKSGPEELIVIYDEFGCYVTKYAVPTRKAGYIRWETKAESYSERGSHILLFSRGFIEVRNVGTGRLVQVIEGVNLRLLQCQPGTPLLIAMHSKQDDQHGIREEIIELVETAPLESPLTSLPPDETNALWQEWD